MEASMEQPMLAQYQGKKHRIPSPANAGTVTGICPSGSTLWACVVEQSPSGARMVVLRWDLAQPNKGWERIGETEDSHGLPSMMVPLRQEGLFLGIGCPFGFVENDGPKASLVARFRLHKGIFQFVDCVEMTLGGLGNIAKHVPSLNPPAGSSPEGLKKEGPPPPWQLASCVIDPPVMEPSLWRPSVSADHLALCAAQSGVVWVFELDKGSLRRTYNLDGLTKDELKKVKLLNFSVLGTAFDPSGRLIVAKRNRELTQIAVKLANETSDPVEAKMQKDDFQMFTDLYKDIRWLALDPETGTRQDLESPGDFPTATPSFRRQTQLRFLVTPNGQVKTNAFCDWEFLKQEAGVSLEAPKKDNSEDAKKAKTEEIKTTVQPVAKESKGRVQ